MRRVSQREFIEMLDSENTQLQEDIYIKKKSLLQRFFSDSKSLIESFSGTLNGDGNTIKNIPKKLFTYIEKESVVKNVTFDLSENRSDTVICETNRGTVKNCELIGDITIKQTEDESEKLGGLVNFNSENGTVTDCKTSVKIIGRNFLGGICGINKGEIFNCKNTGDIRGKGNIGGICGRNLGIIQDCKTKNSTISGEDNYGGICGFSKYTMIERCSVVDCYITHTQSNAFRSGGICGISEECTILDCILQNNTIEGKTGVGGICGYIYQGGIRNSKVKDTVTVDGNEKCGGIAGESARTRFKNIISKGSVKGGHKIGGVVGASDGKFINLLSSASVSRETKIYEEGTIGKFFGVSTDIETEQCYYYGNSSVHSLVGNLVNTDIKNTELSEQELSCIIGF